MLDFAVFVNADNELGTPQGLFYFEKSSTLKNLFTRKKYVGPLLNSSSLIGEHVYPVFAVLKQSGFKKIRCLPIADVGPNSSSFVYEVKEVAINGITDFEDGDSFAESAEVVVHYHAKLKILSPQEMHSYRRKNYVTVGDHFQSLGFTNIYERKIRDLTTGWLIKDGSVEQVLVCIDGEEQPMVKNQMYEYDTKIIITYHTF